MQINNNYNYTNSNKKQINTTKTISYKQLPTFKGDNLELRAKAKATAQKSKKGEIIAGGAALAGAVAAVIKRKQIGSFVSNIFSKNVNKLVDVDKFKGVDLEKQFKEQFLQDFIEPLKNPTFDIKRGLKVRSHPQNGYLAYGPDSKAKEQYFEWMVGELKNAGAEIVEPAPGRKAKNKEVSDEW